MSIDYEAFAAEARRIYFRYAVEVVEALSLCPWARDARDAGRVDCRVIFGARPVVEALLEQVLDAEARDVDVTLLVMPECELGRVELRHATSALLARYEAVRGRALTALAIADFHPDAEPDLGSPERLVPFIRTSPDPTLQLIRHAALERARRGASEGTRAATLEMMLSAPLHVQPAPARVAAANLRTIERVGLVEVRARLAAIAADRGSSYARFVESEPAWRAAR